MSSAKDSLPARSVPGGVGVEGLGASGLIGSGGTGVPARQTQVIVHLSLASASFVLATIQGNVKDLYVRGVTVKAGSAGAFTIHLSNAVATKTKVAWLVVN